MTIKDLVSKYRPGTTTKDGRIVKETGLGGARADGKGNVPCLTVRYTDGSVEVKYS
jgi:hypothetical protein